QLRLPDSRALVGAEDERAVPNDRAARGEPELILLQVRFIRGEKVARIERLVPEVLPQRSMESIRAGAGRRDEQAASKPPILRAEVAGHHLEFLEGVRGRQIEECILQQALVRGAVEADFVFSVASAANDDRRTA